MNIRVDDHALVQLLRDHLPGQRWFGARGVDGIERITVLRKDPPVLLQIIVRGADGDRYQVLVGLRPAGEAQVFYEGKASAMIGEIDGEDHLLAYDATIDPELAIDLLHDILPNEEVSKVRPLGAEQSNTSLVFDERLVLKVFRRLPDGPNPDAEVTRALASVGFERVLAPVGEWRDDENDYAVVNDLLLGAADGWHLAITSLRDLYDLRCAPQDAPGDFGFEVERLGRITAEMHVALADAFGVHGGDVDQWLADMEAQLARVDLDKRLARQVRQTYQALREVAPGPGIRIHGDYHLGQTLRTDTGWFVLDFEGEPARPIAERRRPSSPMRDVAGMVRSLSYAAQVTLREAGGTGDQQLCDLADAWERHNAERFLAGYYGYGEVDRVLPPAESRHVVRRAFELDKAVYEIGYETAHRPDLVEVPLTAVRRMLTAGA